MFDNQGADPTENFTGLAKIYDSARPGYPPEALTAILSHCSLKRGSLLVDVGCGTGISSRAFARFGLVVVGVEPNGEMRQLAESGNDGLTAPVPSYRIGRAEATGLPTAYCEAVAAGQAFHWFEPRAALLEFKRMLKPAGWVILLWNERQESDLFTRSYGDLIRALPQAAKVEKMRSQAAQELLNSELFESGCEMIFENGQDLEEKGLLARAFSSSYAPRQGAAAQQLEDALKALFRKHERENSVTIRYITKVYLARRKG